MTQASLVDPSVPQPFRAHPPVPHPVLQWGCTTCHRGQGAATEVTEAHETTFGWEQPLLPVHLVRHPAAPVTAPICSKRHNSIADVRCSFS